MSEGCETSSLPTGMAAEEPSEPRWGSCAGGLGGCLLVMSCVSFLLCVGANLLQSIYARDQSGTMTRLVPEALPITWGLCGFTLIAAVLGGAAIGLTGCAREGTSGLQAVKGGFAVALLPLRAFVGAAQFLVLLMGCYILTQPTYLSALVAPIVAFVVLSVVQLVLWIVASLLAGEVLADDV